MVDIALPPTPAEEIKERLENAMRQMVLELQAHSGVAVEDITAQFTVSLQSGSVTVEQIFMPDVESAQKPVKKKDNE